MASWNWALATTELSVGSGFSWGLLLGGRAWKKETFPKCFFVNLVGDEKSCQRALYYFENKGVIRARSRNRTSE
jgi:hypothetical protein